jgi:hypothetical protein
MRKCSSDQGGGCFFTVSALGSSPVGLNYYSLVLSSVLLTARADVTSDLLADVIYDTAKRFNKASSYPPYHDILLYNNIHYTTSLNVQVSLVSRPLLALRGTKTDMKNHIQREEE